MELINENAPVLIIAEIGNNHNGDIELAKKLIYSAKESGCDIVKFQKRSPNICVPERYKNISCKTPWGKTMKYIDYRNKIEFSDKEYTIISNFCNEIGIRWFASSWDSASVKFLENFNPPLHKLPSPALTDPELVTELAKTKKQTIISTGASTMELIDSVVNKFESKNFAVAHCTSVYPCSNNYLNLKVILKIRERFNCIVGYSGHEIDILPSLLSIALGATFIERHFTLDRSLPGSDHFFSLEPISFKKLVLMIRETEKALGNGEKMIYNSELKYIKKLRKFHY